MAYSDFSLEDIKTKFQIAISEDVNLFGDTKPFDISEGLLNTLEDNIPLALAIDTEKARSEFIIAPILAEYRKTFKDKISLFSGTDFNVAPQQGLNGQCDFIISRSTEQFYVSTPVIFLVEAKNDRIKTSIPQCFAEMITAQIFNEQRENEIDTIFGVVSTGSLWRFLKLVDNQAYIDLEEYHAREIRKIFGIFAYMIEE